MARSKSFTSRAYQFARISNNVQTLASGNPKRIKRRAVNVAKGRVLARAGFFRWLWR
jgi:hypothetical protein